jgi:hypothetical protein
LSTFGRRRIPVGERDQIAGIHFSKGWSMKLRYLAIVLAMLMIGVFAGTGCSTSNEENLTGSTPVVAKKEGAPNLQGYADAVKYTEEQQKARNAEAKAARKKP